MERGEQLSPTELLKIVQDVKSGGEMPSGLTEDEKRDVRAFLDILYASDKAVKTYWIKMSYLDKAKEALRKKSQCIARAVTSSQHLTNARELSRTLNLALDNCSKAYHALDAEAFKNIGAIDAQIDVIGDNFISQIRKTEKRINDKKKFNAALVLSDVNDYIQSATLNEYLLSRVNSEQADRLSRQFAKLEDVLLTYGKTDSCLGMAIADYKNKATEAYTAIYKEYGILPKDAYVKLHRIYQSEVRRARWFDEQYKERLEDYRKSAADAERERRRTNLVGKWYVVAACGEMLTELGQSLMNG